MLEMKYGVTVGNLDTNGYGKSIMQTDTEQCLMCGNRNGAQLCRHEVCYGTSDRRKSKAMGLWVRICGSGCGCNAHHLAHNNKNIIDNLHRKAQKACDREYGEGTFFRVFGRNYL